MLEGFDYEKRAKPMALDLNVLGYGGIVTLVGSFAAKRLWDWFRFDRQGTSLYEVEKAAHIETRKRFDEERTQMEAEIEEERRERKAVEMLLRETNKAHDEDRKAWRKEKDETLRAMDTLREEVLRLNLRVTELTQLVDRRKLSNDVTG